MRRLVVSRRRGGQRGCRGEAHSWCCSCCCLALSVPRPCAATGWLMMLLARRAMTPTWMTAMDAPNFVPSRTDGRAPVRQRLRHVAECASRCSPLAFSILASVAPVLDVLPSCVVLRERVRYVSGARPRARGERQVPNGVPKCIIYVTRLFGASAGPAPSSCLWANQTDPTGESMHACTCASAHLPSASMPSRARILVRVCVPFCARDVPHTSVHVPGNGTRGQTTTGMDQTAPTGDPMLACTMRMFRAPCACASAHVHPLLACLLHVHTRTHFLARVCAGLRLHACMYM